MPLYEPKGDREKCGEIHQGDRGMPTGLTEKIRGLKI
jgi:hypothetical protein